MILVVDSILSSHRCILALYQVGEVLAPIGHVDQAREALDWKSTVEALRRPCGPQPRPQRDG